MIAVLITTPDYAGLNIKEKLAGLLELSENGKYAGYPVLESKNMRIYTTDERCVYLENIDKEIKADLYIIPTTHRSGAGRNSLSCHTQGNWADADLGGKPRNLSYAPAFYLKKAFNELARQKEKMQLDYEVTLECTHHGPQIESPTIFLEIGSSEEQWKDDDAGKAIANVVLELINFKPEEWKSAIGIGGLHYCNTFNKIMQRTDIALGHICPKYMLEKVDREMIMQAIEKTVPKPGFALLDWKGLGRNKEKIKEILGGLDFPYQRTDRL